MTDRTPKDKDAQRKVAESEEEWRKTFKPRKGYLTVAEEERERQKTLPRGISG